MRTDAWGPLDGVVLFILPGTVLVFSALGFLGYNHGVDTAWYVGFTNIFCAAMITILPIFKRKGWFTAPYWLMMTISLNVMMYGISLFFGLYHYLWWWDGFTHMLSSVLVTMLAFIALCVIEGYTERISLPVPALLLTAFLIGVGIGNAWEMFEGLVDFIVSSNHMQDIYALDTITDIAMDTVGALIMTVMGAAILRRRNAFEVISEMGFGRVMTLMGRKWDRRCMSPEDPGYADICEEIDRMTD